VLSSDAPTVAMEPAPKVKDAFSKCTEALAKRWLDTPSPSNAAASSQTSFDFDAVQSKLVAAISSEEFKEKVRAGVKRQQKQDGLPHIAKPQLVCYFLTFLSLASLATCLLVTGFKVYKVGSEGMEGRGERRPRHALPEDDEAKEGEGGGRKVGERSFT